ncbi:heparinase II/III family protein [Campylobacter sp. MIT 99-7217]|uniref:heparinase II/III domain-containing protein n=1 Tax=Campylobacter sp. MIT 99-7217 TaxID=535091 RepID=UPI00163CFD40|nr:heparinase II/III family protein [Campylobacter sp. MIT 99-7217]
MIKNEMQKLLYEEILDTTETKPYQSIDFNNVNFLQNPFHHTSWIFILHKMDYLVELLEHYQESKDERALELILKILYSWNESVIGGGHLNNPWAFHDHATALRTCNLIKLYKFFMRQNFKRESDFLRSLLQIHLVKLLDEKFYSKMTNHGLDQSIALYQCAFELKDQKAKEKAIARINDELSFAFCEDGGHVENTPSYLHYGLIQVQRCLLLGQTLEGKESKIAFPMEIFKKACLNLGFFTQPNLRLPLIGDTQDFSPRDFVLNDLNIRDSLEYQNYLYLISSGINGQKPDNLELFLEKSGYVILRSSVEKDHFLNSLHFVFKCTHLSNYHRHNDDLSFTLFYDNEEWFLDSGLFEYAENNTLRKYLRSHKAHNLTSPNGVVAHTNLQRSKKTRIEKFINNEKYCEFEGFSYMFDHFENHRKITYDKKNLSFKINDTCKPLDQIATNSMKLNFKNKEKFYTTSFIIPSNKQILIDEKTNKISIQGQNKTCILIAKNFKGSIRLVKGYEKDGKFQGFISRKIGEKEKVYYLEFNHLDFNLNVDFFIFFLDNNAKENQAKIQEITQLELEILKEKYSALIHQTRNCLKPNALAYMWGKRWLEASKSFKKLLFVYFDMYKDLKTFRKQKEFKLQSIDFMIGGGH